MRINHNIQALNTYRQLSVNQNNLSKHLERLSSGLRINRASDDAAGLAISEKMRSQIRGLKVADRNALDGVSMIQTAEGALGEVQSILQRMRELSVQASSGAMSPIDRQTIQSEIDQLTLEIDKISDTTNFNGKSLLAGNLIANAFMTDSSDQINETPPGSGSFSGTIPANDEVYLSFFQTPTAGTDDLVIDNITISFGAVNSGYNAGTNSATVKVDGGETIEDILTEINSIMTTAKADVGAIDNVSNYYIIDNSLYLKSGATSLPIAYNDPDYQPRPDQPLEIPMQLGANAGETMKIEIPNMDTATLGLARLLDHTTIIATPGTNAEAGIDVSSSRIAASNATGFIDNAIDMVILQRSSLGAYQNRLEHTIKNLGTVTENLTAAESRIRDADMALEMTGFTKANVINQAATAMLAQANQMPQGVLQLLQ